MFGSADEEKPIELLCIQGSAKADGKSSVEPQLDPSFGLLSGSTVDPKQRPCADCISTLWLDVATAELA